MKDKATNYLSEFQNGQSYIAYREMLNALRAQGSATGGFTSESYLNYTDMNIRRMRRLDRKPELEPQTIEFMKSFERHMLLLTLTEGWCGDAAQILPVIERMIDLNPALLTRYILRDEHPEIMERFLTEGSRGIPMIIMIDPDSGEVIGNWGPRPKEAQHIIREWKASGGEDYSVVSEQLHAWYAKDKTISIQSEFTSELKKAAAKTTAHS